MRSDQRIPKLLFASAWAALIAVPLIYGREYPKSIGSVFDDVVTLGRFSCFVGFLSDLGIVLWFAIAVLFLHGLYRRPLQSAAAEGPPAGFFLFFALFAFWLGLDDRLLIHEWLIEHWRIPEAVLMAAYGATMLYGGWRHRKWLACPGAVSWLWVAFPCFLASTVIDLGMLDGVLGSLSASNHEVVEEGFKWIGICSLFLYVFVLTGAKPHCD